MKKQSQLEIKSGKLLVAEPFMQDPYFKRSVILLTEHRKDGSIGFIINKQLDMNISELLADFPDFQSTVYYGGPVQTDTIHFIHNVGDLLDDSIPVINGIFWGGDFEKLKFLIDSQLVTPQNIRFYVGYSGWTEGQLTEELKGHSWIPADMDPNYLFKEKPDILWKMVLEHKGNTHSVIGQMNDYNNYN